MDLLGWWNFVFIQTPYLVKNIEGSRISASIFLRIFYSNFIQSIWKLNPLAVMFDKRKEFASILVGPFGLPRWFAVHQMN